MIEVEEAQARLHAHLDVRPRELERVVLGEALRRVLAEDVVAAVDVPGFDRASVDGFALHADDTALASDASPCRLRLNEEIVTPGVVPVLPVPSGTATLIATGGMLPRGADAVTMIEHTETTAASPDGGRWIELRRPVAPGAALAAAGGDIGRGETRPARRGGPDLARDRHARGGRPGRGARPSPPDRGDRLDRRRAAWRRASRSAPGQVYDSNAAILCAAMAEQGGTPVPLGICPDDLDALSAMLERRRRA